jgi:hypothetical protein
MASENTSIINLVGNVVDPTQAAQPDGNTPAFTSGRQGDLLTSEIHGKRFVANYRGKLFEANAVTVTVPANAATLVSVFTLYNPISSGIIMEMVSTTVTQWVATTVVDQVGWYYSTAVLTSKGGFATLGTVQAGVVGNSPANKGQFYTAYTHSGTPVLCDVIGAYGAATNNSAVVRTYDGDLVLPPGIAMSVAMATAAGGTTGLNLEARWIEWPQ